ncbi:hypothetical protein D3C71_1366700 [compost metagenome]
MDARIAGVLLQRERVVELVLQAVAHRRLVAQIMLAVGFAHIAAARHLAVGVFAQRAVGRQVLGQESDLVALILRQQRHARGRAGLPGQRRRQEQPVVLHVVHRRIAVALQGDHAIEPLVGFTHGPRQVHRPLEPVLVPHLQLHFARPLGRGPLADHAGQAARSAFAVQHRGRPPQHFHALKPKGLALPDRAQAQTIQVGRRRTEAPQ